MSIKPTPVAVKLARTDAHFLCPFDQVMAPVVASWVRDEHELFWLAPKTPPPLTAAKIAAWQVRDGQSLMFCQDEIIDPLGYLELNPMPGQQRHLWIGHCVIHPEHRSMGLGRQMVKLALDVAFVCLAAQRLSLVVFPDNMAAIRCYGNVGFIDVGEQHKYFATTGRQHRLLQMTIDIERYRLLYEGHTPH